jgi:hypothetical protein
VELGLYLNQGCATFEFDTHFCGPGEVNHPVKTKFVVFTCQFAIHSTGRLQISRLTAVLRQSDMKKAILSVLKEDNGLNEKKLRKGVLKIIGKEEECGEFGATLAKLVSKNKIALVDDKYKLNTGGDAEAGSDVEKLSRKRANSETSKPDDPPKTKSIKKEPKEVKTETEDHVKSIKSEAKEIKTESTASAKSKKGEAKIKTEPGQSKWNYEDLWKNGEKHWRDGTFDPEYLRTNPDRYAACLAV